jgi:outer membrane protein assembly factor BamB
VLVVLIAACVVAIGLVVTWPMAGPWTDPSLKVVGGPVADGGTVLVLSAGPNRQIDLSAIQGSDGAVLWQRPFSPSLVTPGVAFSPTVVGQVALDLVPAGGPDDPAVTAVGIDVGTGRRLWSLSQPLVVGDAPTTSAFRRSMLRDRAP